MMSQEHIESTNHCPDFIDVDRETDTILKARIKPSTRGTYANDNIRFMIWLYDQSHEYDHLLQPKLLDGMTNMDSRDKQTLTKQGKPSIARTHLRTLYGSSLCNIKPKMEATHPIKLAMLDFQVFSRYLATFKKPSEQKAWLPR